MLCSSCSQVIKPIVAIDIDGTLGDYHRHLMRFAEAYLGRNYPVNVDRQYGGAVPFSEWFCKNFDVDLTTFRQIKLAYRQGAQKRSMPPYQGASTLVNALKRDGVEVWLTTTRPYLRLDNVDPDTRFWLGQHGIEFDGMLYDEDKYHVLGEMVAPDRVVAVLDDLREQLLEAEAVWGRGTCIMRRTIFNRDVNAAGWMEANDLREALAKIQLQIERWHNGRLAAA